MQLVESLSLGQFNFLNKNIEYKLIKSYISRELNIND